MPEKTATEKILGLYTLLLLNPRAWSLTELARHFHCSKPTMLRLISRIERLEGIALKTELRLEEGRWQKWYQLARTPTGAERESLRFSADAMRLLAFARDLAAPFLSEDMGLALDDNLRRAAAHCADAVPEAETGVPLVQPAMLGSIDYAPFAQVLATLLRAIRQRLVCEITYARKPDRTYEMAVTRLVSGHVLYAHGWQVTDKGRVVAGHPLFFAVHRLLGVRLTRRVHDLRSPEEEPGFGVADGAVFPVRLYIAPERASYVRERVFGPAQQIEEAVDGGVILSFLARSDQELLAWVLSLGRHARVMEPPALAEKVRSEARIMLHAP